MVQVIILGSNEKRIKLFEDYLNSQSFTHCSCCNCEEVTEFLHKNSADTILIDTVGMTDTVNICRKIKVETQPMNISVILIADTSKNNSEFLKYGNAYITEPTDRDIFLSTIHSSVQTKKSWDSLSVNNTELAKNLYRLNVLNKTVTALAGSLDKTKLIEIMTEGIEKSLSYSLCYSLVFNDPTDITLVINSVYAISPRLEEAIKFRAMLSYKDLFNIHTTKEQIKVKKNIKNKDIEYDLNVFNFDTGLVPINIKDKFFGIIEVFREKEFSVEDTRWFQTLVKQASFPLQSAVLYEEIKEQNQKLEEMEKKKSEFFSIVSHELKTPLTAIQNASKILQSGAISSIPDRAAFFIGMIKRNGDKLLSIIQDLLDSSKFDAGKLIFNFKVSDINPLVESAYKTQSNVAETNKIDFKISMENELPKLYIDTKRIEQVLTNLISNALKFTPLGGTISISTYLMSDTEIKEKPFSKNKDRIIADKYVIAKVSDTGPGIAEEDRETIFEKFEQVKGTLSRNVGGTGLGLSIAKQFAETHHGFLWLESTVGKGSDFYLALPVLSEFERFEMQLRHDSNSADIDKRSFGVITLCENKLSEKPYLVEFVQKLDADNVFKRTAESKSFYTETKERLYYSFYDINMNTQILNFIYNRISDYIKEDDVIKSGKKMYISCVIYPEQAEDADEIIKKSKKMLKEVAND